MQRRKVPWDFYPEFVTAHPELFDLRHWQENEVMAEGKVGEEYCRICQELDLLLAGYGYVRDGLGVIWFSMADKYDFHKLLLCLFLQASYVKSISFIIIQN